MRIKSVNNKSEQGFALISVLSILVILSLLTAAAVTLSQYSAMEANTFAERTKARYLAEGALNRTIFFLMKDIQAFPVRQLGEEYVGPEERYLADNVIHNIELDGAKVTFQIRDALDGLDISGSSPDHRLNDYLTKLDSKADNQEKFQQMVNRVLDYIDTDEFVRNNGMEKIHYRREGRPVLPRNAPMQFKEELLYVNGIHDYFILDDRGCLDSIRLIAPKGMRALSGRSSLYSVPLNLLAVLCNLNQTEKEQYSYAVKEWQEKKVPLINNLPPGLKSRLDILFSSHESGNYAIILSLTPNEGSVGIMIRAIFRLETTKDKIEFYEYLCY